MKKKIGLYMKNCMEWFMAEQGIFCLGGATVPLYDTLGPDAAEFILKQTGVRAVVSTRMELERLVEVKKGGQCPNFTTVILADGVTAEAMEWAKESQLNIISFAKVEAVGAQHIATNGHQHRPPSGKDIFTFCYTSGTTGEPKGALLTHTNLIAAVAGVSGIFPMEISDRHLSYLPLAHIFERIVMCQVYSAGASIAFYRGDPLLLIDDLQACRPTIFPAAPRVLNKIYDKIQGGFAAAGGFKKKLFDKAIAVKTHNLITKGELKHGLYDRLLFNKIARGLGMDHIRILVSGSAPLSRTVMNFYRIVLGCPVVEGYGQTEGAAAATVSMPEDMMTAGHVGVPSAAVEIVLMDVPEMGYLHTDTLHKRQPCQGRGEILVRGPVVFKGYYKDHEKTRETVDEDGWLHSGDVGLWTMQGQLQIIDRKKNIFKLSQGGMYYRTLYTRAKCRLSPSTSLTATSSFLFVVLVVVVIEYVAPEKIENIIIQSLLVGQAFVYGDSVQSALVAVLIPDEDTVRNMLQKSEETMALAKAPFAEICQNETLKKMIKNEIMKVGKVNGLHGFEIPKSIYLDSEPFSVENGLLTPTFKLKRQQARDKYERQIETMYAELPKPKSNL